MAKQLTFTYEDKTYTLEFTRNSIRAMERRGFIADDISRKPMTVLPDLFAGAFIAHHAQVKRETIDRIYGQLTDKEKLIECLAEMYNDPITSLLDDPEDGKNVTWEKNW